MAERERFVPAQLVRSWPLPIDPLALTTQLPSVSGRSGGEDAGVP